jgi:hypothetical protein
MERQKTLLAPGEISAFAAHETSGRRQACSHASRRGLTGRSRPAVTGKAVQAPTGPPLCVLAARQHTEVPIAYGAHLAYTRKRAESRKWSRNDRVLLDDERHEPHPEEEPDVTTRPTRPERRRYAKQAISHDERGSRRTLSNTTRTCNKLPDVYM